MPSVRGLSNPGHISLTSGPGAITAYFLNPGSVHASVSEACQFYELSLNSYNVSTNYCCTRSVHHTEPKTV